MFFFNLKRGCYNVYPKRYECQHYLFLLLVGTDHRITSAYHPQSNGLVERMNQTLKNTLLKLVNDQQNNWDDLLDPTLFAIRTSRQKSTKYTPFELMFNRSHHFSALYGHCHAVIFSHNIGRQHF